MHGAANVNRCWNGVVGDDAVDVFEDSIVLVEDKVVDQVVLKDGFHLLHFFWREIRPGEVWLQGMEMMMI